MDKEPTHIGQAFSSLLMAGFITLVYLIVYLGIVVFILAGPLSWLLEPIYVKWVGMSLTIFTMPVFYRLYLSDGPDRPHSIATAMFNSSSSKRLGIVIGLAQGISISFICGILSDIDETLSARLFATSFAPYLSGVNTLGQLFCMIGTLILINASKASVSHIESIHRAKPATTK